MITINLEGQVAIVIGAGRGIGEAIALKLAEAGAKLVVADKIKENIIHVTKQVIDMGGECTGYEVDVTDKSQIDEVVAKTVEKYGKIDILANNAGVNVIKKFEDSTKEEFDWIVETNLKGIYNGCRAVIDQMKKQKHGKIVNTASQAGKFAFDYHSMYSATKYGIVGMSQVMAKELGQYSINVNCIGPGIVPTNMWEKNLDEYNEYDDSVTREERWERIINNIPMKRPQSPEDIANAVLFLCSDLATNISGQTLLINGASVCN